MANIELYNNEWNEKQDVGLWIITVIADIWIEPVCLSGVPVGAELEISQEQTEEFRGSSSPLKKVHFFFYASIKTTVPVF